MCSHRISVAQLACALLFSFIDTIPQAYCTRARGLKIDVSSSTREVQGSSAEVPEIHEVVYLHKILENFQHAGSVSEVSVKLGNAVDETL